MSKVYGSRKKQLHSRLLLEEGKARSQRKIGGKDGKMPAFRGSRSWQGVSQLLFSSAAFPAAVDWGILP